VARRARHHRRPWQKRSDIQGPDTVGEYTWAKNDDHALLYQWADIAENDKKYFDGKLCSDGRCALGKPLILDWMRDNKVVTLFRGHQHTGSFLQGMNE
jgi:hypothetical protein